MYPPKQLLILRVNSQQPNISLSTYLVANLTEYMAPFPTYVVTPGDSSVRHPLDAS
jgi:hypothetical protein